MITLEWGLWRFGVHCEDSAIRASQGTDRDQLRPFILNSRAEFQVIKDCLVIRLTTMPR